MSIDRTGNAFPDGWMTLGTQGSMSPMSPMSLHEGATANGEGGTISDHAVQGCYANYGQPDSGEPTRLFQCEAFGDTVYWEFETVDPTTTVHSALALAAGGFTESRFSCSTNSIASTTFELRPWPMSREWAPIFTGLADASPGITVSHTCPATFPPESAALSAAVGAFISAEDASLVARLTDDTGDTATLRHTDGDDLIVDVDVGGVLLGGVGGIEWGCAIELCPLGPARSPRQRPERNALARGTRVSDSLLGGGLY